jgi:hypothetical protein
VADSGLYEICHYDEPRSTVILTVNDVFPHCRKCGDRVRYKLVQAVPHISEDPDFNEVVSAADNLQIDMTAPRQIVPLQLGWAHGFRFWQDTTQAGRDSSEVGDL